MLRRRNFKPEKFKDAIEECAKFKAIVDDTVCPMCKKKSLHVRSFEVTGKGFEAAVECTDAGCEFTSLINQIGFHSEHILKKG